MGDSAQDDSVSDDDAGLESEFSAEAADLSIYSTLDTGTYFLTSTLPGHRVLDVAGGSVGAGVAIQLYGRNETAAQQFILEDLGDARYAFKNVKSGLMFLVSRIIRVLRSALAIAMLGALRGMLDRLVMDSSFRLLSMMIMRLTSPVQMMPMALKFVYIKPMSLRLRFLRLKNLRLLSLPSSRLLMPQILLTVPISFVRQRVVGRRLMSPADLSLRVRMFKYMRSMPRLRKHGPSPMTRTVS